MRIGARTVLRLAAILLVAGAFAAAAIEIARDPAFAPGSGVTPVGQPVERADPLAAELARCTALGEPALRDQACLDAWTESRRRFLAPSAPAPVQGRDVDAARPGAPQRSDPP